MTETSTPLVPRVIEMAAIFMSGDGLVALVQPDRHVRLWQERALLLGVQLFAIGMWLRISEEERLLHAMFGDSCEAYAARVRRFVPGVF